MKCKSLPLILGVTLLLGACRVSTAEEGDSLWSHTYGGDGSDVAYSIIPSDDGGFLLAGWTKSFGAGDEDMWLVKVNADGDSLWSHTYGGYYGEWANSIIPAGDGGFLLAGDTYSFGAGGFDMWLVKVNSVGDSLWSRTFGGSESDWAGDIFPVGDGGFLLAGSTTSFGAGNQDIWLVKINADGDSLWSRTYGGWAGDAAHSITSSGDGGFLLAGRTSSFGAGDQDMWLVKVNADGDSLWSHTYGGWADEDALSIIPFGDGGFLLAGYTFSFGTGDQDMWLVKVNADGYALWAHTYGGGDEDAARSIASAGNGGFLLTGWTTSFGAGDYDIWLVKVDSQGDSLWSHTFGGNGWDEAFSVLPSGDGGFLLAGTTDSYGAGFDNMWLVCVEGIVAVEPEISPIHPSSFTLHPPHPNPFNATAVLSFELPMASLVRLEVFDINGRNVGARRASPLPSEGAHSRAPLREYFPAGPHQITFDGSGLPSGIYLAKLTAGDLSAVQKLVLMK